MFFFLRTALLLDEEFDAPDIAADHEMCRAIAAGKAGLHPDAWGNHDPLPLRWLLRRCNDPPPAYKRDHHPNPADLAWEAEHRRRPPTEWRVPRLSRASTWAPPPTAGELRLTCDECRRAYSATLVYHRGMREESVAAIRKLGAVTGWTCIVGRDRCPRCSEFAPPEAKGNGAGPGQGNEQHADRG